VHRIAMLLFVALGNPGARHARNRHNIGFMVVEAIARRYAFAPFRARFQSRASEGQIAGERIVIIEPQTFMNESGRAVQEAARFYKIPLEGIVVFHDELDLALGKLRVKVGGGNAGHNGLRSITAHIGNDYKRVRLGIGHPGNKGLVYSYVLNDFGKAEEPWVEALCSATADHVPLLAKRDDVHFQSKVHLAMEAAGLAEVNSVGARR
jgi:PTH1 family peptidyl-tRNA hydrolase